MYQVRSQRDHIAEPRDMAKVGGDGWLGPAGVIRQNGRVEESVQQEESENRSRSEGDTWTSRSCPGSSRRWAGIRLERESRHCESRGATDGVGAEEESAVGNAKEPWKLPLPLWDQIWL